MLTKTWFTVPRNSNNIYAVLEKELWKRTKTKNKQKPASWCDILVQKHYILLRKTDFDPKNWRKRTLPPWRIRCLPRGWLFPKNNISVDVIFTSGFCSPSCSSCYVCENEKNLKRKHAVTWKNKKKKKRKKKETETGRLKKRRKRQKTETTFEKAFQAWQQLGLWQWASSQEKGKGRRKGIVKSGREKKEENCWDSMSQRKTSVSSSEGIRQANSTDMATGHEKKKEEKKKNRQKTRQEYRRTWCGVKRGLTGMLHIIGTGTSQTWRNSGQLACHCGIGLLKRVLCFVVVVPEGRKEGRKRQHSQALLLLSSPILLPRQKISPVLQAGNWASPG